MIETLINNVALDRSEPGQFTSVGIQSGRFVFIEKPDQVSAKWQIDAEGCLMMPAMVEPHAHLDKSYSPLYSSLYSPVMNSGASADDTDKDALINAIASMAHVKTTRSLNEIEQRARRGIERAISKGVCHLRSHLDLGQPSDLDVIERMIEVGNSYKDKIHIEFTLLCSLEDQAKIALAKKAFALGAHAIGGAPALTDDPQGNIDRALDFAVELNCPVDLHIDETEDPASNCLEYLADQVIERSFSLPVLASHCCSLVFQEPADRARIIEKLARSGVHIVSLPACNLYLMGRKTTPAPRGATAVNELMAAGVNVCAGSDNVQDPFHPWGDYEPLGTACSAAAVSHLDAREPGQVVDMVTQSAAKAMGLTSYGIEVGHVANFCLLRCTSLQQAIAERSLRTWVFFEGRPVIKQTLEQVWIDPQASKTAFINPF